MQNKIFSFSSSFNIKGVLLYQKIFLISLSARFLAVKYIFDDPTFPSYGFSSFDKINLVVNLKNSFVFPLNSKFSIQFKKSLGQSYTSPLIYIYGTFLSSLLLLSLLPILESKSDRFGYVSKFYRKPYDFSAFLHYALVNRDCLNYSCSTEILNLFSDFQAFENFFVKCVPFNKKILISFFKFWDLPSIGICTFPIFQALFEFIFLGLVRFGQERIKHLFVIFIIKLNFRVFHN